MASFLYDPNSWKNLYGLHVGWPFCLRGLLVLCTPAASTDKPGGDHPPMGLWQVVFGFAALWKC